MKREMVATVTSLVGTFAEILTFGVRKTKTVGKAKKAPGRVLRAVRGVVHDVETLDEILELLELYRQRATYGAVGEVLDQPAVSVMKGEPRDARHSWVVSASTHQPTGYSEEEQHPDLETRSRVLSDGDELRAWLRDPH